jgi:hypothetical protein
MIAAIYARKSTEQIGVNDEEKSDGYSPTITNKLAIHVYSKEAMTGGR